MARVSAAVVVYVWMCLCLSAALSASLRNDQRSKDRRLDKQINCINFVFHPKCRGTAAKRVPPAVKSSPDGESANTDAAGEPSYDVNTGLSSVSDENGLLVDRDLADRVLDSMPSVGAQQARPRVPSRTDLISNVLRDSPADVMAIAAEAMAAAEADAQSQPRSHRTSDLDGYWQGMPAKPSDASRYGWVLFRKRTKEQDSAYDY